MKLTDLKPAEYNPREITDEALSGLEKSIDEFGDLSGIVFNERTGNLVAGHQRIKALQKKYGNLEIANRQIKLPTGEVFKVRYVDWDIKKEKLANITANNPNIQGDFTSDLTPLLEDIQIDFPDLYDDLQLDIEIPTFENEITDEENEKLNEVPEVQKEAVSKLGDLFLIDGRHRILCGDATSEKDVAVLMDGKKADMVFTDPPYNIGFSYNQHNDKMQYKDYEKFCSNFFRLLDCERIVITPGPRNLSIWYTIIPIRDLGWYKETEVDDIFEMGVWYKKNSRSGASCFHFRQCEPIIFYGKFDIKRNFDFFEFTRIIKKELREAQENIINKKDVAPAKPVSLLFDIFSSYSKQEDIIKDVFLGNGTALITSERLKRICYGTEIDPTYIDVILRRYKNLFPNAEIKCLNREFDFSKL
ncbi:MAG: DNA modification methylase [PVC group bacterium]|nr:DNA modification methylase [PVC group bacterium]